MSAILNREPGTSAQSEKNQVTTSTTTQQNGFTVQQIQPQAIFAGSAILTSSKAAHLTSTFSVVISRRSQGWMRTDRWRHKQALLTLQLHFWSLFINCCFNYKLFHWVCMNNFVFIHWPSLLWTAIFVPFGLETSDRRKPAECLSPCREANKIICFCSFAFLFGHIINILSTELGRSVRENLDLGHWYGPHCIQSVLATLVKILPYRPPARLIRATYIFLLGTGSHKMI